MSMNEAMFEEPTEFDFATYQGHFSLYNFAQILWRYCVESILFPQQEESLLIKVIPPLSVSYRLANMQVKCYVL